MNYRHAYHAGNFADVFKHSVLARLIEYLKRKDGAFRVIDTHAGIGLYDLSSVETARTGEWISGIGRLVDAQLPDAAAQLLAPYLDVVRTYEKDGQLAAYPGSPVLTRALLRRQDRLSACELHPEDHARLAEHFAGDFQVRVMHLDGWLVSGAHLPPKEKRGLVLIDPPFEKDGDFDRMVDALEKGHRRWPGGMFCLWYPLKNPRQVSNFVEILRKSGLPDLLRVEIDVRAPREGTGLAGSGLIIKRPPFVLVDELAIMMPALVDILGQDEGAGWRSEWLGPVS